MFLQDIVNVCTRYVDVQLGALYTNFADCDPDGPAGALGAASVQRRVLDGCSSAAARASAEHRALRRLAYPPPPQRLASGSFVARWPSAGDLVDVLLSAASFHGRDLRRHRLSSVAFVRPTVEAFRQRYLGPLDAQALHTSNKLY